MVRAVDPLPQFPDPRKEHLEPPLIRGYAGRVDETRIDSKVPDVRAVPFGEIPAVAVQAAVQRVLPDRPVATVQVGGGEFSSSI
jgi:hypothetical protein